MSFLSVLKSIGHALQTGVTDVTPVLQVASTIPALGTIPTIVLGAITTVEGLVTTAGNGAAKKSAVTTIVNAVSPGINQVDLSAAIDAIVSGLNAVEAAISTITAAKPPAATS
jgi:hypothetical protein